MNQRLALTLLVTVTVGIVTGCGVPGQTRSAFLSGFSGKNIIEKASAQMAGIEPGGVSSGETSSVWKDRRIYHRDESADLRVNPADEDTFLVKLKSEIERSLENSDSKVLGGGSVGGSSGGRGFSVAYTDGRNHGWVDVFGMRGIDNNYKLIIIVNES